MQERERERERLCFFSSNISKENLKEKGNGINDSDLSFERREEGIIKEWELNELTKKNELDESRETWLNLCEEEKHSFKKDNTLTSNIFYLSYSLLQNYINKHILSFQGYLLCVIIHTTGFWEENL